MALIKICFAPSGGVTHPAHLHSPGRCPGLDSVMAFQAVGERLHVITNGSSLNEEHYSKRKKA